MNERLENSAGTQARVRLCIVTPYLPSVSETFIRGHIERLPAETVLVHGWPPSINSHPVLSWPQRIGHKVWRRLARTGISKETTAAYLSAFRRSKANAVLAEYGTTGVLTVEACRQLKLPLVVYFHGYDASVREVLAENAETYPAMFKEAAGIIAVSRAMQRRLIALGAAAEKVHYNPCGIDCSVFGGARPEDAPPVFVAVGRFVEKKAPQLTLRAFAGVARMMPEARLRMIGDGPLLEECQQLVEELQIASAVTFLGAQSPAVVQSEMRAARAFVQHSLEAANGDCEGTPVGILEAGASGLAVVSTRHAGIPDVVVEGKTGLLVDERDVEGMSEGMLSLARDPELAGRMGRAARSHIENNFSEQHSLGRLMEIIESAIATKP